MDSWVDLLTMRKMHQIYDFTGGRADFRSEVEGVGHLFAGMMDEAMTLLEKSLLYIYNSVYLINVSSQKRLFGCSHDFFY